MIWQALYEIVASAPRETLEANSRPLGSHLSDRRPILGIPTSKFAL